MTLSSSYIFSVCFLESTKVLTVKALIKEKKTFSTYFLFPLLFIHFHLFIYLNKHPEGICAVTRSYLTRCVSFTYSARRRSDLTLRNTTKFVEGKGDGDFRGAIVIEKGRGGSKIE